MRGSVETRHLTRLVALAALGLAVSGCGRSSDDRAAPTSPSANAQNSAGAAATRDGGTPQGAASSSTPRPLAEAPTRDDQRDKEQLCDQGASRALAQASAAVVEGRPADTSSLERSDTALAHAYLAYAAHRKGDAAAARRYFLAGRARLDPSFDHTGRADAEATTLVDILRLVRGAREGLNDICVDPMTGAPGHEIGWQPPEVPCALFLQHPREAVEAFGPVWGSGRDSEGAAILEGCQRDLLRRVTGSNVSAMVAAELQMGMLIYDVIELPASGTMWRTIAAGCIDEIRNAPYLTPSREHVAAAGERLRSAVAAIQKHKPHVPKRLPSFTQKSARFVAPVAEAICGMKKLRGEPVDAAACREAAEAVAKGALACWLSANTPKPGSDEAAPHE
jgi:hypothetical protein